jgi:hypothetical protein
LAAGAEDVRAEAEPKGEADAKGEAADAEPPKTLVFTPPPTLPNGEAVEEASFANPELAKADVGLLSLSSAGRSVVSIGLAALVSSVVFSVAGAVSADSVVSWDAGQYGEEPCCDR